MISSERDVALSGCIVLNGATIGYKSYANDSVIRSMVTIGRYCSIGRRCTIGAANHRVDWLTTYPIYADRNLANPDLLRRAEARKVTTIGNDVWIGDNAIIIEGITVGDGAVIAAGAVVTKDVVPYMVVGGVPAKPIRARFEAHVVAQLMSLSWWNYDQSILQDAPLDDIAASIEMISARIGAGHKVLPPHHKLIDRGGKKPKRRSLLGKLRRLIDSPIPT